MKKIPAIVLSLLIICAPNSDGLRAQEQTSSTEETAVATVPEATAAPAKAALPAQLKETIDIHGFEDVIYATENGQSVVSYADGTLENGEEITLDSSLPVGSVSKQFCAAEIMLLQERGKLSVNDTLDMYYPDYAQGAKLTLHNLLSMRSGIPEMTEDSGVEISADGTEAENAEAIKEWVFSQQLNAEPGKKFSYANINYFLLAGVVEQASGEKYDDFLRESFFEPQA